MGPTVPESENFRQPEHGGPVNETMSSIGVFTAISRFWFIHVDPHFFEAYVGRPPVGLPRGSAGSLCPITLDQTLLWLPLLRLLSAFQSPQRGRWQSGTVDQQTWQALLDMKQAPWALLTKISGVSSNVLVLYLTGRQHSTHWCCQRYWIAIPKISPLASSWVDIARKAEAVQLLFQLLVPLGLLAKSSLPL